MGHGSFRAQKGRIIMATLIPLISSGVAGPIGILHLPRLWLKVTLDAARLLPPEYPACGKGFDSLVLKYLNVNEEATLDYIWRQKPTYPQFEAWVKLQPGVRIDSATIRALNAGIRTFLHGSEARQEILKANGIPDDDNAPLDAVALNNLDDWLSFHKAAVGGASSAGDDSGAVQTALPIEESQIAPAPVPSAPEAWAGEPMSV